MVAYINTIPLPYVLRAELFSHPVTKAFLSYSSFVCAKGAMSESVCPRDEDKRGKGEGVSKQ
jgi:hypothetical protein